MADAGARTVTYPEGTPVEPVPPGGLARPLFNAWEARQKARSKRRDAGESMPEEWPIRLDGQVRWVERRLLVSDPLVSPRRRHARVG